MKILYIHRTKGIGVEGVHIYSMINALKKQGHSVEVAGPGYEESEGGRSKEMMNLSSRYMPELVYEILELLFNFKTYNQIRAKLRDVDLIYERYAFFGFMGAWAATRHEIPFVIELNYTSLNPLVRKRSRVLMPLCRLVERYVLRRAVSVVCVSSQIVEDVVGNHSVDRARTCLVPNAADPAKFPAVPAKRGKPVVCIGFVGGFYPWHGVDFLVEAFSHLIAKSKKQYRLVLIGDGPEREKIERLVSEKRLDDMVTMHGYVDHDELSDYMETLDIGIMPNSNDYGSPMKIFEYMAMGIPVIAPDYRPLLDVMDARNGLIFRRNDMQDLIEKIRALGEDETRLRELSGTARAYIENCWNWDLAATKVLTCVSRRLADLAS